MPSTIRMHPEALTYEYIPYQSLQTMRELHSADESSMDCRQYWRKFSGLSSIVESVNMYWRKFSGFSPIGESAMGVLAKVQ